MHRSKHFLSCNSPAHVYLKGNLVHLFLIHLHWTHQKSCWHVLCLAKFSMGFWKIPIYYWILFGVLGLLGFVFFSSIQGEWRMLWTGVIPNLQSSALPSLTLSGSQSLISLEREQSTRHPQGLRSLLPCSEQSLRDGSGEGEKCFRGDLARRLITKWRVL